MKKFASIFLAVLLLAVSGLALAEPVTIGATPVPHAEVLEFIKPLMAEKGFELEITVFNDYVLPNTAVDAGELDANYFQTADYLFSFNADNGTALALAIPVHYEPMGVYKGKTTDLADLPDGATIGVPNDASNESRALKVLEAMGLIELGAEAGMNATKLDVTVNEKNLEFVEIEAAQLPRMLQDFDLAVINGNYAMDAGLSLTEDAVGAEDTSAEGYVGRVNYLVVKEGNEDAPFVTALREAFNDQSTIDFINEKYQGAVVLALDVEIPTPEVE